MSQLELFGAPALAVASDIWRCAECRQPINGRGECACGPCKGCELCREDPSLDYGPSS